MNCSITAAIPAHTAAPSSRSGGMCMMLTPHPASKHNIDLTFRRFLNCTSCTAADDYCVALQCDVPCGLGSCARWTHLMRTALDRKPALASCHSAGAYHGAAGAYTCEDGESLLRLGLLAEGLQAERVSAGGPCWRRRQAPLRHPAVTHRCGIDPPHLHRRARNPLQARRGPS